MATIARKYAGVTAAVGAYVVIGAVGVFATTMILDSKHPSVIAGPVVTQIVHVPAPTETVSTPAHGGSGSTSAPSTPRPQPGTGVVALPAPRPTTSAPGSRPVPSSRPSSRPSAGQSVPPSADVSTPLVGAAVSAGPVHLDVNLPPGVLTSLVPTPAENGCDAITVASITLLLNWAPCNPHRSRTQTGGTR